MDSSEAQHQVVETVSRLVKETISHSDRAIGGDEDLFEAGLESMGIMQLIMQLEERYGIEIGDAEITRRNFQTVTALVALVERMLGSKE